MLNTKYKYVTRDKEGNNISWEKVINKTLGKITNTVHGLGVVVGFNELDGSLYVEVFSNNKKFGVYTDINKDSEWCHLFYNKDVFGLKMWEKVKYNNFEEVSQNELPPQQLKAFKDFKANLYRDETIEAQKRQINDLKTQLNEFKKKQAWNDQKEILRELNQNFNIVTCGDCGEIMIHKHNVEELFCHSCGFEGDLADFPDLFNI